LWVVVVPGVDLEELELLPPHPATARVDIDTAAIVSMAASGVLLMGRAPIVAGGLGRPPYQAFHRPIEPA